MKRLKQFLITLVVIGVVAGAVCGYLAFQNWSIRFSSALDQFFGEGNWECVSEESKTSRMYTEYYRSRDTRLSEEVPGSYKNWDIMFTKKNGEPEIWTITNHTWKINNDKYGFLSAKRYSAKQALVLELMDISHGLVCDELHMELFQGQLSEQEADCIEIDMMYHGGNPKPKFYDKLWKEEWFNSTDATVAGYLTTELYDFYLYIRVHNYKLEKLTDEEKANVLAGLQKAEQTLLERYGNYASFEIYFGEEQGEEHVEYVDGVKQ